MPDLAAIGAVFTSVKTATDIVKALREADFSLEKAELKMKVAELTSALADLKLEATEVLDEIRKRDARIEELEEALETRANVTRVRDGIYEVDEKGQAIGDAFCIACWESKHRLFSLQTAPANVHVKRCGNCNREYMARQVMKMQTSGAVDS